MEQGTTLFREYEYFKANLESYKQNNINQFAAIYDNTLIGFYKSVKEAVVDCVNQGYVLGKFLVEYITDDKDYYHVTIVNWRSC